MTDKKSYVEFCEIHESQIPLFFKPWWLTAVCGENWQVVVVIKGDVLQGAWVYYTSKKFFFKLLLTPKLTPYHGVYLNYPPGQKPATTRSFEKKTINALYNKLPAFDFLDQNLHPALDNVQPFYWNGFSQSIRYTFTLNTAQPARVLWKGLNSSIRRAVKKASERYRLVVTEREDIDGFYELNKQTFERKGMVPGYGLKFLKKVDEEAAAHKARKILFAVDEQNRKHAACYLVYDEQTVYYLMGGVNTALKNTEAATLVMWRAIEFAAENNFKQFDFEGSMIEPVARFFSSFGAQQVPYHRISKVNHFLLKLIKK